MDPPMGVVRPAMDAIAEAYQRKFSAETATSPFTEDTAFPTFRVSSSVSSLRLATIASASACRRRERSFGGVFPQGPSRAALAASIARSTSASPAIAALASGAPVAGSVSSRTSPDAGSTASPSMKSPNSRCVTTAMGGKIPA